MNIYPVIRIEIEHIRESVTRMLALRNDDLNRMVKASLEKQLTEDAIQEKIDIEITRCIDEAIKGLSTNYQLRGVLCDVIADTIARKFKEEA